MTTKLKNKLQLLNSEISWNSARTRTVKTKHVQKIQAHAGLASVLGRDFS